MTHSAFATPSAPPESGLMYTGPHTDTGPAPGTCRKDKLCAQLLLKKVVHQSVIQPKTSVTILTNLLRHENNKNTNLVTASPVCYISLFHIIVHLETVRQNKQYEDVHTYITLLMCFFYSINNQTRNLIHKKGK